MEADGPGDGGGVVTPNCQLGVGEVEHGVQKQAVEEDAGHFEVVDGEVAAVGSGDDVLGPRQAPHHGMQGAGACQPGAPDPVFGSIHVANVGREVRHQLCTLGGVGADNVNMARRSEMACHWGDSGWMMMAAWLDRWALWRSR